MVMFVAFIFWPEIDAVADDSTGCFSGGNPAKVADRSGGLLAATEMRRGPSL